jgi:hypothetical protein
MYANYQKIRLLGTKRALPGSSRSRASWGVSGSNALDIAYKPQPKRPSLYLVEPETAIRSKRPTSVHTWRKQEVLRRQKAVFKAISAALVLFLAFSIYWGLNSPSYPKPGYVTVTANETLWSIATQLEPGKDPRPLIYYLENETKDRPLYPGERLYIP